jgi:hypothetical protein
VAERTSIDERIAAARARLAANLGALNERFARVRKLVSPATYLDNAWVNLGLGIAIGYVVGRRPRRKRLSSGGRPAPAPSRSIGDELLKAAVRAAVSGIAGALIRRALARETKRSE